MMSPFTNILEELLSQTLGQENLGTKHATEINQQGQLTLAGFRTIDISPHSVGAGISVPISVWLIMKSVLLSHIIDDLVDNYGNHQLVRVELEKTFELFHQQDWDDNLIELVFDESFRLLWECIGRDHSRPVQEALAEQLMSIHPDRKGIYQRSWLKLIVAGLAQTVFDWQLSQNFSEEEAYQRQNKLVGIYRQLMSYGLSESRFTAWFNSLPFEINIASASSLQDMFLVHDKSEIDWNLIAVWDCILGPLLYRFNRKEEFVNQNIRFFDVQATDESYNAAIRQALSFAQTYGNSDQRRVRYRQLQVIWSALNDPNSPHNLTDWGDDPVVRNLHRFTANL